MADSPDTFVPIVTNVLSEIVFSLGLIAVRMRMAKYLLLPSVDLRVNVLNFVLPEREKEILWLGSVPKYIHIYKEILYASSLINCQFI